MYEVGNAQVEVKQIMCKGLVEIVRAVSEALEQGGLVNVGTDECQGPSR